MLGYFVRRLIMLLPVFLAMSAIVFLIVHLVPGDPIDHMLQIGASAERRQELAAKFGLDRPLVVQYALWLKAALTGDLGEAIILKQPVVDLILANLPYSLALGLSALLFSTVVGVSVGAAAAYFAGSWFDRVVMAGILMGSMLPSFWLGLLMILIFAVELGLFPVSGARSWDALVLPVLTVGIGGVALIARVTRAAFVEVAQQDFVTLLHAKGLTRRRIFFRHLVRHALMPVVTILGLKVGWILGGAVTVEYVFARPGLGSLLITSLGQRDYPVVQGCLLMLGMGVMLGTLVGDLAQAAMDPRVRDRMS
ncbi:glutathione ABC transporter permease [Prosthecomicrobium hirschii]|uniref:Glutathione ABC transporter permease n=1 Tax=Prosthecodimorpha hirschii TaxID=665126 RepID=A0A0P6VQC8_9HYPH|nr:ABC transporter permease [Prosthecomicrobium hirschii]KPL53396.1 glutathione ABC transporter permease [Prosthecomicrobium hirschii]